MKRKLYSVVFRQIAKLFGPRLQQNATNGFLDRMKIAPLPTRRASHFPLTAIFLVLLFAGVTESATTWASGSLANFGTSVPSVDSIFREIKGISEAKMTHYVNQQLQALPAALPRQQHARRRNRRYLVIDFHKDPDYSKTHRRGTVKGQPKDSSQWAWSFLVAELVIGTRKRTVAMVPRHRKESIADQVTRLFAEIPAEITYRAVLFDGEFATTETLRFFQLHGIKFLGRCPARGQLRSILIGADKTPAAKARRFWKRTCFTNKADQDAWFDVTWEWTPGGPKLLIKSIDWDLNITSAETLYARRFNIESGFRDRHLFQPRTNSGNIAVRLMLVFVGMVWWNIFEAGIPAARPTGSREEIWAGQLRTFRMHAFFAISARVMTEL